MGILPGSKLMICKQLLEIKPDVILDESPIDNKWPMMDWLKGCADYSKNEAVEKPQQFSSILKTIMQRSCLMISKAGMTTSSKWSSLKRSKPSIQHAVPILNNPLPILLLLICSGWSRVWGEDLGFMKPKTNAQYSISIAHSETFKWKHIFPWFAMSTRPFSTWCPSFHSMKKTLAKWWTSMPEETKPWSVTSWTTIADLKIKLWLFFVAIFIDMPSSKVLTDHNRSIVLDWLQNLAPKIWCLNLRRAGIT